MNIRCKNHVAINNNTLLLNNNLVVVQQPSASDLFAAAYQQLQLNYPKFFKMDNLCKTGFLAAELLLQKFNLKEKYAAEEIGIVLATRNSSLDTDVRYMESTNTNPSPALFVYTLPNVLIGELCIRHQIKGESACFVFDNFDAAFQTNYVNMLMKANNIRACISGWADFFDNKAEAFFYLAAQSDEPDGLLHNEETIQNIYSQTWKN